MSVNETQLLIGFLTVVEVPELGFCGGYLLINALGRPVEFHCTAPVQENKTQKILYGKTYSSFLFCDQIGRALIAKTKQNARIIIADRDELASMSESLAQPLLIAQNPELQNEVGNVNDCNDSFVIGDQSFIIHSVVPDEIEVAKACCRTLLKAIPLDEPFERIRQAIDEAQAVIR